MTKTVAVLLNEVGGQFFQHVSRLTRLSFCNLQSYIYVNENDRMLDSVLMRSIVRWPDMLVCTYLASYALRIFDSARNRK